MRLTAAALQHLFHVFSARSKHYDAGQWQAAEGEWSCAAQWAAATPREYCGYGCTFLFVVVIPGQVSPQWAHAWHVHAPQQWHMYILN